MNTQNRIARPAGISDEVWSKAQEGLDKGLASSFLRATSTEYERMAVATGIQSARVRLSVQSATMHSRVEADINAKLYRARTMLTLTEAERTLLGVKDASPKVPTVKVEPTYTIDAAENAATDAAVTGNGA